MQVIVIWSNKDSLKDGLVNVLNYGDGEARIYDKDAVDPRLGSIPLVEGLAAATRYMAENPNQPIQFPLQDAVKCGLV